MKEWYYRIKILLVLLGSAHSDWKEICKDGVDAHFCCDDRECGCGGASVREMYLGITARAVEGE